MRDFIALVQEMFPSISPYTADKALKSISDNFKDKRHMEFCTSMPFDFLAQGDIFSEMPFAYTDEEGNDRTFPAKGFLLSNTCDSERDEFILFAPMLPIDVYTRQGLDKHGIESNKFTKLLFIPSQVINNHVVDLSIINAFPRNLILKLLELQKISKEATLNLWGYYLYLSKLTVHLMRPEDIETNNNRAC